MVFGERQAERILREYLRLPGQPARPRARAGSPRAPQPHPRELTAIPLLGGLHQIAKLEDPDENPSLATLEKVAKALGLAGQCWV